MSRTSASQPLRWPALPESPRVLLGATVTEYAREHYCHLGPIVMAVEHRLNGGWKWSTGFYGRTWTARIKLNRYGREAGE